MAQKKLISPSNDNAAAIWRAWLRQLPALVGKSHTAIATELGLAVTTLTRPLRPDDPGTSAPNQGTIEKIVNRYGIAPPDFGQRAVSAFRRPLRGFQEDAAPYRPSGDDALSSAVRALIAGRSAADPWIVKSRALELAGYLPGDVVIVDLGRTPQIGDAVCAQINIDFSRMTAETVMRIYERAGATDVLVARSMDPSMQQPVALDHRAAIKGVIVGMVRPPHRDAAA